ncbi:MAG: Rrf2 family transcriptional regulator [Candidatus Zixiibacteriota bacterium]
MFSLSKRTEYGLSALTYLSSLHDGQIANAAQIANNLVLPKELLSKIMSELVKAGLANSFAGPSGGFQLARNAANVSLADIIIALENKPALIECASDEDICGKFSSCRIRLPMQRVNVQMENIFKETTLSDFVAERYKI